MRKFGLILFVIVLLSGCDKANYHHIDTIIEEENGMIGISYPQTGFSKLDKAILNYVDEKYNDFKKNYQKENLKEKPELNIDYTLTHAGDYLSITLETFINTPTLAHPVTEMKTFVYHKKILTLKDFITEEQLTELVPYLQTKLLEKYQNCILLEKMQNTITSDFSHYPLFTVSSHHLTLYFNPYQLASGYCSILTIDIPLERIGKKPIAEQVVAKEVKEQTLKKRTVDITSKVVALTFDDGPSKYTDQIIEYFHENDVVGTFFMLGNKVNTYQETVRKLLSYGNEIGNHSYNHQLLSRLSADDIRKQIDKTQELIHNITGYYPTLLRPTYGSVNSKIKATTNLEIVLWNVDTLDWKTKNPDKLAEKTLADIKDGSIVLMHDTKSQTYKALKIIVPKLKEEGYTFVTVSELQEIKLLRKYHESEARKN